MNKVGKKYRGEGAVVKIDCPLPTIPMVLILVKGA